MIYFTHSINQRVWDESSVTRNAAGQFAKARVSVRKQIEQEGPPPR